MSDAPKYLFVSYLAMTQPPLGAPLPAPLPDAKVARETLSADDYIALYRAVGAPWGRDTYLYEHAIPKKTKRSVGSAAG